MYSGQPQRADPGDKSRADPDRSRADPGDKSRADPEKSRADPCNPGGGSR